MVYTIARTAGRRVRSSPSIRMATKPIHTELLFPNDPRLVGAIASAVEHAAEQAGMSCEAQKQFAAAAEDACREALPFGCNCDQRLKCTIDNFGDRIEVVLEHFAAKRGSNGPAIPEKIGSSVDHVRSERMDQIARVTLVKFIH